MQASMYQITLSAIKDQHPYLSTLYEQVGEAANSEFTVGVYSELADLELLTMIFPNVAFWIKGDSIPADCQVFDKFMSF